MRRALVHTSVLLILALPCFAGDRAARSAAMERIEKAQQQTFERPKDRRAYADLATAWTERGRETADPTCYARAIESLTVARALPVADTPSSNLDLVEAWVRLGLHEFERAESIAQEVVKVRDADPAA